MNKINSLQGILQDQLMIPGKLLKTFTAFGLNETELVLILQLLRFHDENKYFPTLPELAESMTINEKQCSDILRKLIQKDYLKIKTKEDETGKIAEAYSVEPLLEKLYREVEPQEETNIGTIFILFEQEFGRPLSPFEIDMINTWLDEDQLSPALIKAGLRESVLMGKLNFKYIDRILREWQKKGIRTVEQARNAGRPFHRHQTTQQQKETEKRDTTIYYNWLEEGED